MSTTYKAVTPYGAFQAEWSDDEDSRVEYTGSADAIAYFKAFLDLNSVSGAGGALIQFDALEPADLYGFCQSEQHGISVIPTEDDLNDEAMENDEMNTTPVPVLDAVSPAEAFELIGEGAQILTRLDESADTFFPDLDRLRHIVTELGDDAPAVDPAYTAAAAKLQAVIDGTASLSDAGLVAELTEIHSAYNADPEMYDLFKRAVGVYSAYAIEKANEALAK